MASNTMATCLFTSSHTRVVHGTQEENGDNTWQWHHNDQAFCVGGSGWKDKQEKKGLVSKGGGNDDQGLKDDLFLVESQEPLWRNVPISSSKLIPYYRLFAKWNPINRETYLDRLSIRFKCEGEPNTLPPVDVYVTTVDPVKEPPIITANIVLFILAVDYPVDKICCYVSDDGASMLLFDVLSETAEFARRWVPFCKKHNIEPRAPEFYFSQKFDYLKDKVHPNFVKERSAIKAQKKPKKGWVMQDGTPWPGNNSRDHPVYLGSATGARDVDSEELPRLVYVSCEKRPGYQHQKKAGAMNALVRMSAVLTNAPSMLNLDCDHYINNSKAVREVMCFLMDPQLGKELCYVQFPQRVDGIDRHDRYANRNLVFFDINMRGLDGIQGPLYVGTGCVFNRQALYGYDPLVSEKHLKMTCGCWPSWCFCGCCRGPMKSKKHGVRSLVGGLYPKKKKMMGRKQASTLLEYGGLPKGTNSQKVVREAIYVISCGYEDKTEWGKERNNYATIWVMGLFLSIIATGIVELRWSNVSIKDWWRNEQFWVIGGVSAHLFAVFQGLLKVLTGVDTAFRVTSKAAKDAEFRELYLFEWTSLLVPPPTLPILNMVGVFAGDSGAIKNGYHSGVLCVASCFSPSGSLFIFILSSRV
ncbi:hypothetical protein C1H46_004577 [Malus baccata]|uniref:cellulose synthase (UDP-forming) n=1 Tax=Malus baccata TaxID=106549 RepID=A0A540NGR5_MALBA|nr:hypothetical protein C1H46_004577 [Malus baccata]